MMILVEIFVAILAGVTILAILTPPFLWLFVKWLDYWLY